MTGIQRLVSATAVVAGLLIADAAAQSGRRVGSTLRFEENRGQFEPGVQFLARAGRLSAFVGRGGFVVQVVTDESGGGGPIRPEPDEPEPPPLTREGVNLAFTFVEPARRVDPIGLEPLPGLRHYLRTNDRSRWARHVRSFAATRFSDIWDGVSLDLSERSGRLEFDVLLEPGADIESAVLRCQGADRLTVDDRGQLVIETPLTTFAFSAPVSWDVAPDGRRHALDSSFVLRSDDTFGFDVPGWSGERPLCIDPGIPFGTYLGSTYDDVAYSVGVDDSGDVFVSGRAGNAADFPISPGAFQSTSAGGGEAFVTRLDPTMRTLRYSTFVAGSSTTDWPLSFFVDDEGFAYAAGFTNSSDFPTTPGAWQTSFGGDRDAYVFKLVPDGSDLVYSTFVGGSEYDTAWGLDVHTDGTASITGYTESADFPVTPGALQSNEGSGLNAFYSRVAANGGSGCSTYLPAHRGYDIAVDSSGDAVVIGNDPDGIPTTPGAFDSTKSSDFDGFVIKVTGDGTELIFATYLGGAGSDELKAVEIDHAGVIYITGSTGATNFPVTSDAFDSTHNLGFTDGFITLMEPDGTDLVYSTFYGGNDTDTPYAIAPTSDGALVIVGFTRSSNMPTTSDALQPFLSLDGRDGFIVILRPGDAELDYASYLGGQINDISSGDPLNDVTETTTGNLYIVGSSSAIDLPIPSTAFQPALADRQEGFAVMLAFTPWLELGGTLPGSSSPTLTGAGALEAGSAGALEISDGPDSAMAHLIVGVAELAGPVKSGTLVPTPDLVITLPTDSRGGVQLPWGAWPSSLPPGLTIYFQGWFADPGAPKGWAASNAILAVTP